MKYLCLAYDEEEKLNALSRSEWDALRGETLAYVEALRKSGHLIVTQALQSARAGATVQVRSGKLSVTDDPFAETKEQLGGFFLIDAKDLNEAIQWRHAGRRHALGASRCGRSRKSSDKTGATDNHRLCLFTDPEGRMLGLWQPLVDHKSP